MTFSITVESPVGTLFLTLDGDGGLISLSYSGKRENNESSVPEFDRVKREIDGYFSGKRQKFALNLRPRGTDFQKRVWAALSSVPFGATISYKELAVKAGCPNAVRAVARAVGANPIAIIIPCHRVIASDGTLGGYSAGIGDGGPKSKENLAIKKYLLGLEKKSTQSR